MEALLGARSQNFNDLLEQNIALPPAFETDARRSSVIYPLSVNVNSVIGNKLLELEEGDKAQIHIQLSLFDGTCRHFFGKSWIGPSVLYKTSPRIPYNQTVYMHTSVSDPNILLVVEVVATVFTNNGATETFGCGWGVHKIFKPVGNVGGTGSVEIASVSSKSIDLHYGSPRALLFLHGEIEGNELMKKSGNCQVVCSVRLHKPLIPAADLVPENVFIGQSDLVPGLYQGQKDPKTGAVDRLRDPLLSNPVLCALERIVVRVTPSVEKFEETLCKQLLEEYMRREDVPISGKGVQVIKRYLKIGVHNGWSYISHPEEVQLTLDSAASALNKGASFKFGHRRTASAGLAVSTATSLVHRSRVEVDGLMDDNQFNLVFTLLYDLSVPSPQDDMTISKKRLAEPVFTVAVRWASFCPFEKAEDSDHTVQLKGGVGINPDSVFVYRADKPTNTSEISGAIKKLIGLAPGASVSFSISLGKKSRDLSADRLTTADLAFSRQARSLMSAAPPSEAGDLITDRPPRSKRSGKSSPTLSYQQQQQQQEMYMQQQQAAHYSKSYPVIPYGMTPRGYLPVDLQAVTSLQAGDVTQDGWKEMPYSNMNLPILARIPGMHSGQSLSRAAYARLHTVGFPPVLDDKGEAACVVDPADAVIFVPAKELQDRRKVNEIILQFMAFSKVSPYESHDGTKHSSTVFFTFQFYRFDQVNSERLMLTDMESELAADRKSLPFILRRLDKDGSVLAGPPGYQVKYVVDPLYMDPGEGGLFVKYLAEQTLHIDVWDGDSLLLIGSCIVELRHLCRQGREAVQVSYELDVFSTDYIERDGLMSGDVTRGGAQLPFESTTTVKGRLHLKLGNIGHVTDAKLSARLKSKTFKQVVMQQKNAESFESQYRARIRRAQNLVDISQELAQMIRSRKAGGMISDSLGSAESKKKLARMQAIRQLEGFKDTAPAVTMRKEKEERSRDLRTIELFRTNSKRDEILCMLNSSITDQQTLHVALGTTEFFEYVLKNPYNSDLVINIDWNDQDLAVITDPREWRYFKMIHEVMTPLEENMFSTENKSDKPQLFLRAKESVHVPFRFLTFQTEQDSAALHMMPSDPYRPSNQVTKARRELLSRDIKVWFKTKDYKPIAILAINIEHQPHVINQTFRFNHPEQTFLKKSIRLPPLHTIVTDKPIGSPPVDQVFVRCSDPNVICDTKKVKPGEPHDIFIKAAVGSSPSIKRFHIAAYVDAYLTRPIQVWQMYVHAMNRVDAAAVAGQTSRFTLVLRGTQSSRLVQCFSSNPDELSVEPREAFMLPANSLQEVSVGVRPTHTGTKCLQINVVDIEFHQLVHSWLVSVISQPPVINKTFELVLPVGGGKGSNQKITFSNPYANKRLFNVRTNRYDLLMVKETRLELGPHETATIRLLFAPNMSPGHAEILVFINDEDDKNEETFRVSATYQRMK